jgi:hypothetical protein
VTTTRDTRNYVFARKADFTGCVHKVDVIGHQAIGPDFHTTFHGLLRQQIAINFLVAPLEKDGLSPIAALSYMMRRKRNGNARQASHGAS